MTPLSQIEALLKEYPPTHKAGCALWSINGAIPVMAGGSCVGLRVRTDEERATVHCSCGLDALLASLREAGAEHHQNCSKRAWLNDGPCTCGAEATGDPAPPVDMRQRLDSLERGIDALNAAATSPKDGQA